jgi:5-methylcytosine-specific restriction protein B
MLGDYQRMSKAEFDPRVLDRVKEVRDRMHDAGRLLPREAIESYFAQFRAKYGPDALQRLDGVALLEGMHGRKNRDSLMYWLEFKNDDEFAAPEFGSIAGGSALKFGLYERAGTGEWVAGAARAQKQISREEAIHTARLQRDELLAAVKILNGLGPIGTFDPEGVNFDVLDGDLRLAMPGLYDSGWSHKYLALIFPDRIDEFHSLLYQRFHHVRLLLMPPEGRFKASQAFIALARILGEPVQRITAVLKELHGGPYSYWRLGTVIDGQSGWESMRKGGYAAVGWSSLGDLTDVAVGELDKDSWESRFAEHYAHEHAPTESNQRRQLLDFIRNAQERDIVVAVDGQRVLGIGSIRGQYEYHLERKPFVNARPVDWHNEDSWKLEEGVRTTFRAVKAVGNWLIIEQYLFERSIQPVRRSILTTAAALPVLEPLVARVERVLRRKGQVILYGPPGTGKTYWGERAVFELASRAWFDRAFDPRDGTSRTTLMQAGAVEMCSFHPAYGYEDFLEGYRPRTRLDSGVMSFELRDGVFKRLCSRASGDPQRPFYLLIDEINRGDIPRIFGELLSALEWDKRGKNFTLPLSERSFTVPGNVFVVGTMNTADRSIALLDAALRRRFGFVELMPSGEPLRTAVVAGIPLGAWLVALNRRILEYVGRDARNLQIGHAYLLERGSPVSTPDRFVEVLQEDVLPLLQEYCYEDFSLLEKILGKGLVDVERKRIREGVFDPSHRQELFAALLAAFPDLGATSEVLAKIDDEEDGDSKDDERTSE